jgi:hypothetical protein
VLLIAEILLPSRTDCDVLLIMSLDLDLQHPLPIPYQSIRPDYSIVSRERLLPRPGTPSMQPTGPYQRRTPCPFSSSSYHQSSLLRNITFCTLHAYTATRYMHTRIKCARPTLSQTPMTPVTTCTVRRRHHHMHIQSRHHSQHVLSHFLVPRL